MPTDELYPPTGYGGWWIPVAIVLIVIVAAWLVWVMRPARKPHNVPVAPPVPQPMQARHTIESIRHACLVRINEIDQRFQTGKLDARGLHTELSTVVRDFATVRLGIDATTMTLADICALTGTQPLAMLIQSYYLPEFSLDGPQASSPMQALAGARQVVSQW